MSILIKDMEMPTSCGYCPFKYLTMEGDECMFDVAYTTYQSRPKDCPLIPIPPHGRLIDAGSLIAVYERKIERHKEQAEKAAMKGAGYTNDMYIIDRNRDIISALKAAPTIIPAEEEKV